MVLNTYLRLLVLVFLCSCSGHPPAVEDALRQAGGNRAELEKVIDRYSSHPEDSLKLRAAYFLIGNMPGHYFYKGALLDGYFSLLDSTLDSTKYARIRTIFDSHAEAHGAYTAESSARVRDVEVLKADYLIRNIDQAFAVWESQPWGKDIPFETFCEYILPYRLSDEAPDTYDWRRELFARYNPLLDSVRANNGDAVAACRRICAGIKDSLSGGGWAAFLGVLPAFGPGRLNKYDIGTCREQAHFATYVMRALGIPVAVENTPQWPFRSMGHTWNAVIGPDGRGIRFMGTETAPGQPHKEDHTYAKIFRETFSHNRAGLAGRIGDEAVPDLFRNPFFVDVTAEYIPTAAIRLDAGAARAGDYLYLAVFNNQDWVPVDWAQVDQSGKATFHHAGRKVVYLPVSYARNGIAGAGPPLKVKPDGSHVRLAAGRQVQQLVLTRKYPFDKHLHLFLQRMQGGRFQAARKPDFSDAKDIHVVDGIPGGKKHTVKVKAGRYRYVRYLGPAGGRCNIAEMEVLGHDGTELEGEIIGTDSSWVDFVRSKAFDKDIVTFFEAPMPDGGWVGLDLGKPEYITAISFVPRNDGNIIEKGDFYELFLWADNWKSLGGKVAAADSLVYSGVPAGALYLLRNRTKGKEERIFTYEKGKQVWW